MTVYQDNAKLSPEVDWTPHTNYSRAVSLSKTSGKPLLLYFHSKTCDGCTHLSENVLSSIDVKRMIQGNFIPVWVEVESDTADALISGLVGSHIFIMSSVLQITNADDDIIHKVSCAPLHTRLSLGYTRVHHDTNDKPSALEVLEQLDIGLAKFQIEEGFNGKAKSTLNKSFEYFSDESTYWKQVADETRIKSQIDVIEPPSDMSQLSAAVWTFSQNLTKVKDTELMVDWRGRLGLGSWSHYSDCLREVVFGLYQGLMDIPVQADADHALRHDKEPQTQRLLSDWHESFRHLQGIALGLETHILDAQHFHSAFSLGKQRTIRNNLTHCVMAEFWAHAPAIRSCLSEIRTNSKSQPTSPAEVIKKYGRPPKSFGSAQGLYDCWETRHWQLFNELMTVRDSELDSKLSWWENNPITARFRISRLAWHLQDHAAVLQTICQRLGRQRKETELLSFRLLCALGKAEASLKFTSSDKLREMESELVRQFTDRNAEIKELYIHN